MGGKENMKHIKYDTRNINLENNNRILLLKTIVIGPFMY